MAVRERLVEKALPKQCRHRILVPSERNAMRIKALTTAEPSRSSARPALEEDFWRWRGSERRAGTATLIVADCHWIWVTSRRSYLLCWRVVIEHEVGCAIAVQDSHAAMHVLLLPAVALARRVAVVGAGWGGLSAAHHLSKQPGVEVILDAAPRVGGLIRDGFTTPGRRTGRTARLLGRVSQYFSLTDELGLDRDEIFTRYASRANIAKRPQAVARLCRQVDAAHRPRSGSLHKL